MSLTTEDTLLMIGIIKICQSRQVFLEDEKEKVEKLLEKLVNTIPMLSLDSLPKVDIDQEYPDSREFTDSELPEPDFVFNNDIIYEEEIPRLFIPEAVSFFGKPLSPIAEVDEPIEPSKKPVVVSILSNVLE
jgi:hypothetical protein